MPGLLPSSRDSVTWACADCQTAAVTALLDRLLNHAHVLKCGPRSWRTKVHTDVRAEKGTSKTWTPVGARMRPRQWSADSV